MPEHLEQSWSLNIYIFIIEIIGHCSSKPEHILFKKKKKKLPRLLSNTRSVFLQYISRMELNNIVLLDKSLPVSFSL